MSSPLRLLTALSICLLAAVVVGCGEPDRPRTPSPSGAAQATAPPAAPALLDTTSVELVAQVRKLLPEVTPGIEALYVIAAAPGSEGPRSLAPEVRTAAQTALRRAYGLPKLRLVDTNGQGIACGSNLIANAAGDAVPYGLGLVVDLVEGQAWLARSSDICMSVAYDRKDPAAVGALPSGRVIGRIATPVT